MIFTDTLHIEKENDTLSKTGMEFFIQQFENRKYFVSPHIHPATELLLIIHGKFKVFTDSAEFILNEGDAILFRSNQIHRVYLMSEKGGYYVSKFSPSFIMQIGGSEFGVSYLLSLTLRQKNDASLWRREECEKSGISAAVKNLEEETRKSDICAQLGVKVGAANVLLKILRAVNQNDSETAEKQFNPQLAHRIYSTIAYIEEHYADDLSAEYCAIKEGMSYSYFSRNFKKITGKSFKDYLTNVRINRAEKELRSTDKPITEIALACGFNNIAYFSAVYKSRTGITPSQARNN